MQVRIVTGSAIKCPFVPGTDRNQVPGDLVLLRLVAIDTKKVMAPHVDVNFLVGVEQATV